MRKNDNVTPIKPRTRAGAKIANAFNLRCELRSNGLTQNLVGFNEFSLELGLLRPIPRPGLQTPDDFIPRAWIDADDTALAEFLNVAGFLKPTRSLIRDVVELEARGNSFHPVRDFLDSLAWDATPRLSRFLIEHCGAVITGDKAEDEETAAAYIEHVTRAFFIGGVARIYRPGCKLDTMIILEGAQGILKSQLLRVLAVRDEWFSDSLPHDLSTKDAKVHLRGVWIVEMSEIGHLRRSEVGAVKNFLSCQADRYRPPYGRSDVIAPRQCIFVGTTNEQEYLHDPTGNRRFWPVKVTRVDLASITPIVDQLWAEAVNAYRSGEKWWLDIKQEEVAAEEQSNRMQLDPWFQPIAEFVGKTTATSITTADVLDHLQVDVSRRERAHEMRVGTTLRQLGWQRGRPRGGGRRAYVYTRRPRCAHCGKGDEAGALKQCAVDGVALLLHDCCISEFNPDQHHEDYGDNGAGDWDVHNRSTNNE